MNVFSDPAVQPTDELIGDALGASVQAWTGFGDALTAAGVTVGWRYYRDGGWLAKAVRGSKTVAWMSVDKGFARVTFYFAARLRDALCDAADVPARVRDEIKAGAAVGKLVPVTLELRTPADVADAEAVLGCKLKLK